MARSPGLPRVGDGWLIAVGADSSYPTQRLALALEATGAQSTPATAIGVYVLGQVGVGPDEAWEVLRQSWPLLRPALSG